MAQGSSDRSLMVNPLSYFSFQPVLNDWCNNSRGMCYPVCGMMYIKEPLLLIGNVAHAAAAGFLSRYMSVSLPYVCQCITSVIRKGAVCIFLLFRNVLYNDTLKIIASDLMGRRIDLSWWTH